MFIYSICDPCYMPFFFFRNIGPQTEMIIFLKYLLKFDMEIDNLKKLNKYLQFELSFDYDLNTVWSSTYIVTIKVKSKSKFKIVCFTGGFKGQYKVNTRTDVTKFLSNQIITQIKKYSNVIFPKLWIQKEIHLMSHWKVKKVKGHISKIWDTG